MIVVAIVGILAAIAIPNFLRYQAKSRQAEVKINLGGIFVAETSFYGEIGTFGSFQDIGFALAGSSNRYTYRSRLWAGMEPVLPTARRSRPATSPPAPEARPPRTPLWRPEAVRTRSDLRRPARRTSTMTVRSTSGTSTTLRRTFNSPTGTT
jgi:type II secretory pathway pseudopilin PulG